MTLFEMLQIGALIVVPVTGWVVSVVARMRSRLADVEHKVIEVEASVNAVDVLTELKAVHERCNELASTTSNLDGQLGQMNTTLNLLHGHLLETRNE